METHKTTQPNKVPATPLNVFKAQLAKDYQNQVTNYFSGDKEKTMKFMSAIAHSVQKVPALLECDRSTLMTAFMACAEYQLYPSSVSGEAYVLPYKGKAQFQLGYQGLITLFYRAGIETVNTQIVYANDMFEYEEGLNPRLVHKPTSFGQQKGEPIGVYAIANVNGKPIFKVMSKEDVLAFREFSQAKNSDFSPWNAKNDPELHMWRKTCIKQLAKVLPKNETINKAIAKDNEESTLHNTGLDAAGVATGRALHAPVKDDVEIVPDHDQTQHEEK